MYIVVFEDNSKGLYTLVMNSFVRVGGLLIAVLFFLLVDDRKLGVSKLICTWLAITSNESLIFHIIFYGYIVRLKKWTCNSHIGFSHMA